MTTTTPKPFKCPKCGATFTAKQATMPCRGATGAMHPPTRQVPNA